jgi:BMFP domain-containing protein YqiC
MKKKLLIAFCLIFGLLPGTRVLAVEDTFRTDILEARVNALENKAKASGSKMEALAAKISQLENRLDTNDSKMKYMVRQDAELESRIDDLEAAQPLGTPVKEETNPEETQETP